VSIAFSTKRLSAVPQPTLNPALQLHSSATMLFRYSLSFAVTSWGRFTNNLKIYLKIILSPVVRLS